MCGSGGVWSWRWEQKKRKAQNGVSAAVLVSQAVGASHKDLKEASEQCTFKFKKVLENTRGKSVHESSSCWVQDTTPTGTIFKEGANKYMQEDHCTE